MRSRNMTDLLDSTLPQQDNLPEYLNTKAEIVLDDEAVVIDFGRNDTKRLFLRLYSVFGQTVSSNELYRVAKGSAHMNRVGILVERANHIIADLGLRIINDYSNGYRLVRGSENTRIFTRYPRDLKLHNGEVIQVVCSKDIFQVLEVISAYPDGVSVHDILSRTYIKSLADIEKFINRYRRLVKPHGYNIVLMYVDGVKTYKLARIEPEEL